MARVLLGVKGMDTMDSAERVWETLMALEGIIKVDVSPQQQATVEYNEDDLTTMDMIRALRRIGFLAGME
jgi:copper chaperone CopZ